MNTNDQKQRRSIRIKGYDYTQQGAYFITICTAERTPALSVVTGSGIRLTDIGRIVEQEWHRTAELRPNVDLGMHIIMPNHIHAIIWLIDEYTNISTQRLPEESFSQPTTNSLSTIVRSYKSSVTRRFHLIPGYQSQKLWQRNFYEHVIRDEYDLLRVRQYIMQNPAKWDERRDATPDLWI